MSARSFEYRRTTLQRRLALLALCAVLFACGQVGPLYLPGEEPPGSRNDEAAAPVSTPSEEPDRSSGDEERPDSS